MGGELLPRLARVAGPGDEVEPEVRGDRQRLDAVALELILGMLLAKGWGGGRFEGAGPDDRGDRPRLGRVLQLDLAPHAVHAQVADEAVAAGRLRVEPEVPGAQAQDPHVGLDVALAVEKRRVAPAVDL